MVRSHIFQVHVFYTELDLALGWFVYDDLHIVYCHRHRNLDDKQSHLDPFLTIWQDSVKNTKELSFKNHVKHGKTYQTDQCEAIVGFTPGKTLSKVTKINMFKC